MTTFNPYITSATRIDGPAGTNFCGVSQGKDLTDTVVHEARHAYRYLQGGTNNPANDGDQDFLVLVIRIAPIDNFIDSTTSRKVCETTDYTTLMKAYKGDAVKDSFQDPDWVYWAWEYDAELYASLHNH
jgi:hypothetical protein